jgi:ribosomal protein L3 glutamine methyltransferase
VNAASIHALPPEYKHEPLLALAGGTDGMDLVRKIVAGAKEHLAPHGQIIIEIGNEYAYAEAAFSNYELTWLSTSVGDEAVFLLNAEQL